MLAADKAGLVAARRVVHSKEAVRLNRLCLPFQRERLERFDFGGPTQELERRPTDQHLSRLRRLLQAGCDVDRVTRCQALLRSGDDLARGDADAAFDSELREGLTHPDCRPAGPQGVVLMCKRRPEDGHDRVADELLDRAAVALDDRLHPREVAGKQRTYCLRVGRLPERRRADDVAEENRHDLAARGSAHDYRCPAVGAKLERLSGLVAANSTCSHDPTLGLQRRKNKFSRFALPARNYVAGAGDRAI